MLIDKMKIFISYTIHDSEITHELLQQIREYLSQFAEPYIDLLNGNSLQETVERAVRESALLLIILTENVYKSQWVERELEIAREYNIPIVPMTVNQILSLKEEEAIKYIFSFNNNSPRYPKNIPHAVNSVFISHSNADKIFIQQICNLFKYLGYSTYVDWLDKRLPKNTNETTASILKERIEENDKFILIATNSAIRSYWCNWELGLGDAKKYNFNKIALLPIHDPTCKWVSHEYLRIYPTIHFFNESKIDYSSLGISNLRKMSNYVWNLNLEFKDLVENFWGNDDPVFWKEKKHPDPFKWFVHPIKDEEKDLYVFFPTGKSSKQETAINVDVMKLRDWLQME